MDRNKPGWFKSTFSEVNESCVEVLFVEEMALVRHSKAPFGPAIVFDRAEWEAFVLGVFAGQFTMPQL